LITENLSTLQIHKLTQEQYNRALAEGRIDERAIYLTPDEVANNGGNGTISQGDFAWSIRDNNHYSLIWKGENE
jgi:hypothetical protein